ncbi:MAG: PaaI family thioesterase [Dehalococcoidia bacterium]|nr:PaaI family thioesterase [Dehalococcoidia bacterium]
MTTPFPASARAKDWNERSRGFLPGFIGLEVTGLGEGFARGRLAIEQHHLAPNGFLHAATIIAVADTLSGYGCVQSLPAGAAGFTTVEVKSNFIGTARDGAIACEARLVHGGRTTQVWDAEVADEVTGNVIALFRCTQMILYRG